MSTPTLRRSWQPPSPTSHSSKASTASTLYLIPYYVNIHSFYTANNLDNPANAPGRPSNTSVCFPYYGSKAHNAIETSSKNMATLDKDIIVSTLL